MITLEEHFDHFNRASETSTPAPAYVPGKWGYAIYPYHDVHLKYDSSYFPASAAVSFWLNLQGLPSAGATGRIIDTAGMSSMTAGDITIGVNASGKPFVRQWKASTSEWLYGLATTTLALGTWYWIVCEYGIGGMHIYVNGVEETTITPSGSTQLRPDRDVYIGDYPDDGSYRGINGYIDWLRVAEADLTDAWEDEILNNPALGFRLEHDDGYFVFPNSFSPGGIQMDTRVDAIEVPRRDGAYIGNTPPLASRRIQIRGMLIEASPLLLRGVMDQLQAALNRGVQKLYLHDDRYINAIKTSFSTDYDETSFSRYCTIAIDFMTEEPFWTSGDESSDTWSSPSGTREIVVGGTAYTTPSFEITVASTGTLDIELALGGQNLSLTGHVTAGDVIEVDASAQTVNNDSYDEYEYMNFFDGSFFALQPGLNELVYTHNSGVAVSSIVTRWRNRWH